jgi:sugar-specific transcriptional regulator TrmB
LNKLSKERIINALKGLGLKQDDILVYIFLAKNGSHDERKISEILGFHLRQTLGSLKNLQEVEIVKAVGEDPVQYSVMPFEELIDLYIEVKKEQTKTMENSKEDLIANWQTMMKKNSGT